MPFLVFGTKDGEIAGILQTSAAFVTEHLSEASAEAASWGFEVSVDTSVVSQDEIDETLRDDGAMVQLRTYLRTLRDPSVP